eukprot:g3828.t1
MPKKKKTEISNGKNVINVLKPIPAKTVQLDGLNTYTCVCQIGWEGTHCDIPTVCGTYAVAGYNEDFDGPKTIRESRGTSGNCSACPAGQLGTNPEDDCQACGLLFDPNLGSLFRGEWGNCSGCPKGSYAATITDDCQICGNYSDPVADPPYGTTAKSGATNVTECMCGPGKMYVPSEEICGECQGGAGVPGFYKSTYGNGACTRCPANSETETIGSTSVLNCKCGAGYRYDATDNSNHCKYCPANHFKPLVENAECTSCPEGSSVAQATDSGSLATSIIDCICNAGRERDNTNNQCNLCSAGKYRAESSSNEDKCISMTSPARSTCGPGEGFNSASATATNFKGSSLNDGTCTSCPAGKFKSLSGAVGCSTMTHHTCSAGQSYSSESAGADLEGATSDDGVCTSCPAGKYKESIGLGLNGATTPCKFCPAGFAFDRSDEACKGCDPGNYQNENDQADVVCTVCRAGTFANTSNTTVCTNCPAGKNLVVVAKDDTQHDEAEDCQLCEVGKYNHEPGLGDPCYDCETAVKPLFRKRMVVLCYSGVVYTFGIPLFLFWRLHQSRRYLYEEECPRNEMHKHAIVKHRMGAIYEDYTPNSYYFDLLDMLRRLLLTGGLILLGESSNVQIFIGGLICTCWLCLVLIKRPYRAYWDNVLSVATSFQLLLIILSGMALEIYRLTPQYAQDPYQKQAFGMFMVVASVGVIAAGCLVLLIAVPCVRDRQRSRELLWRHGLLSSGEFSFFWFSTSRHIALVL